MNSRNFDAFFWKATGNHPYPFQREFAEAPSLPQIVRIPTGLGKTAMALIGWLWRRFGGDEKRRENTPRRLVYCLPMRVLVEQTRECALDWLGATGLLAGSIAREPGRNGERGRVSAETYRWNFDAVGRVGVHVLMGGEKVEDWDIHPESEAILIGTQDMLLSRALNRGYAASRSRWPIQFGLLNTDCLWVFDEIQLMGTGLATTAQLEAFRRLLASSDLPRAKDGYGCRSVWMSATMQRDWLETVDFAPCVEDLPSLELTDEDHAHENLEQLWGAKKPLVKAGATMGDAAKIASEVRNAHKPGKRTIVVVNTVKRACELFEALNTAEGGSPRKGGKSKKARVLEKDTGPPADPTPRVVLLHSRFRPEDRKRQVGDALAQIQPGGPGIIVVSTQVIEAGVDVSATTLFTELAPWASLVQRFGRCNRRGEADEQADVRWIDLPSAGMEDAALPYDPEDLESARDHLKHLEGVGLSALAGSKIELPFEHVHVIRRKDLVDLFDTTPDLAGNDIDIDRFVREVEGSDVRVFWRDWKQPEGYEPPPEDIPAPRREELCPAPIGSKRSPGFRDFSTRHAGRIWRWNFLEDAWERADPNKISPGQVFLVHTGAGGYSPERGWAPASAEKVVPVPSQDAPVPCEANETDFLSRLGVWQTIVEHTDDTARELDRILEALPATRDEDAALRHAARWHDRGKAHDVFQRALPGNGAPDRAGFWAKAPPDSSKRYSRRHFRHELASALAVLHPQNGEIPDDVRDLVAYLVAAHHGKVRLSIRSLPNESRPDGGRRFARGIWDGDELPATDLGGGVAAPAVTLSLEPMELGLCMEAPFAGRPSWAERMIRLRDTLGPFRLAYLEALLRAADMRASRAAARDLGDGRETP